MFKFNKCKNDPLPVWCAPVAAAKKPSHAIKTKILASLMLTILLFAYFQRPEATNHVPDPTTCRHSPSTMFTATTSEFRVKEESPAATRASAKASPSAPDLSKWMNASACASRKSPTTGAESSVLDSRAWTQRRSKVRCQSTPAQIWPISPASGARLFTSGTANVTMCSSTTWQTPVKFTTESMARRRVCSSLTSTQAALCGAWSTSTEIRLLASFWTRAPTCATTPRQCVVNKQRRCRPCLEKRSTT